MARGDPASILLLAGEASGDAYGAALARELGRRIPGVELRGTGGPRMREAGVDLLADLDALAVMGFAEVLPRLAFFRRLERRVEGLLVGGGVRLVVPIDFPGFNLRVSRAARSRRVPVLYYVAPKVWAWRAGRARELARVADRVAVILPFEVDFLARFGVRATFVGHPLMDLEPEATPDRAELCRRWGIDAGRNVLALLPGSRVQEIRSHLALFAEAAKRVQGSRPDVLPVIARAPTLARDAFERLGLPVVDDARALLGISRAGVIKSGTATLEGALAGAPMVVAYRTSAVTWALARRLVRVEHVGLPNLIAGERIVPERLQAEATAERLAADVLGLLDEGPARARQLDGFACVRSRLGGAGATRRVADLALELLGGSR